MIILPFAWGWRCAASIPELNVLSVLPPGSSDGEPYRKFEPIFAKFRRCRARPALSSSFDRSIGAQRCFGIGRQLAFLYLVDAFYCSYFCNQWPRYREWARLFLSGAGSVFARGRMIAFDKQLADLTSRVNQLENAEQRRLALEVKRRGQNRRK